MKDKKFSGNVPMQEYDPYLVISGIPDYANDSSATGEFRSNSMGFRSPEIGEKRAFRVVVAGGSVVWGTGASSNEATFPGLMRKVLKQEYGQDVEVINAGMGAYFSFAELTLVTHRLVYLDPDLVIFFNGYNDVFFSSQIRDEDFVYNQVQTYYELKSFLLLSTDAGRKQDLFTIAKRKITKKLQGKSNFAELDRTVRLSSYSGSFSVSLQGVRNYLKKHGDDL